MVDTDTQAEVVAKRPSDTLSNMEPEAVIVKLPDMLTPAEAE